MVGTIFLTALFNQQLALSIIYFSGGHVDSVQLLVANLSFVLTVSAGLHYLGYFHDALRARLPSPGWAAIRLAFVPSVLASITTALGFVSLCTSEIVPIRRFGMYAAIVVPINSIIVVTLVAIHAEWANSRSWNWRRIVDTHSQDADNRSTPKRTWIDFQVDSLKVRPLATLALWMFVVASMGWGVTYLKTSVGTHKLLPPSDKLIRDYGWLESNIGPLVPIELVLRFNKTESSTPLSLFEQVRILNEVRVNFQKMPEISCTYSALNFLPTIPRSAGMRNTIRRSVINAAVTNSFQQLRDMRLVYEDDVEQSWRLSGRVSGSEPPEYEPLLNRIQSMIQSMPDIANRPELHVDVSGGVPFVYRTQRQLLQDLMSSFTSAFIMIALTMAVLFRSISAGLLSMLPNVTPAAIVFGMMGWCGLEVELGTVLTASVMMGVCVDDTLHLITHFCMLRRDGHSRVGAVHEALRSCGGAMFQTALVCGVGMLVFVLSSFTPVARFAWLTFALLMVGLISDLILTPAILMSPLCSAFYRERKATKHAASLPSPAPIAAPSGSLAPAFLLQSAEKSGIEIANATADVDSKTSSSEPREFGA